MKILIADDNHDTVLGLKILLEARGHTVETVTDGGQAMAMMAKSNPDVVVLDLMMGKINGLEFLDSKATSEWARIPVLIFSGYANIDQPIPESAGVVGTLLKADNPEALLAKIEAMAMRKPDAVK